MIKSIIIVGIIVWIYRKFPKTSYRKTTRYRNGKRTVTRSASRKGWM